MITKILALAFLIFSTTAAFAQVIDISRSDSVTLNFEKDTLSHKVYVTMWKLPSHSAMVDTFLLGKTRPSRLKSRDSLSRYLQAIIDDGISKKLADTVDATLLKSTFFTIHILPTTKVEPPPPLPPLKGLDWFDALGDLLTVTNVILIILVALAFFFLFMSVRSRSKNTSVNDEKDYKLPPVLIDRFKHLEGRKDKEKDLAQKIISKFADLEAELQQKKDNEIKIQERLFKSEEIVGEREKEIFQLGQRIDQKEKELKEHMDNLELFDIRAEKLLKNFITPLSRVHQSSSSKEEVYKELLSNIFLFAFHSSSLLKKRVKEASQLDALNLQLIDGDYPKPNGVVNDHTQYEQIDPLAYYAYHLLKEHQVSNLKGVFVNGLQLGN